MIQELDSFGIRFEKNENGDYDVKKVHHIGTYVLPMPNGHHVKKALYRQLRRAQRADLQPLHGDASVDRRQTAASPARSASTPARPSSW